MDKNRKKNFKIYICFLVSFLIFSIYGFVKFNGDTKEKTNKPKAVKCNVDNSNDSNNKVKTYNEIGSEYKDKSIDLVKKFLKSYHLIQTKDPASEFKNVSDILAEPLYLELEHEVIGNSSMNNKGLLYRTIEDMKIYDYSFDDESKDIHLKADVHSNWLNEKKEISAKNELTKYDFLITNFSGDWKISQITTEVY